MKVSAPIIAFTGTLLAAVLLGACGGGSAPASTAPTGDAVVAANGAPATKPVDGTGATSAAGTSDRLTSTSATVQASQNDRLATAAAAAATNTAAFVATYRASGAASATALVISGATSNALANGTREAARAAANATATVGAIAKAATNTAAVAAQAARAAANATAIAPTPLPTSTPRPVVDASAAAPLTRLAETLLVLRDNPQLATDELLLPLALQQVRAEQTAWTEVDCFAKPAATKGCGNIQARLSPGGKLNPTRSTFTFEWQKYIDQQPDFARGPLLDVFLRENADWSFVKREQGWDDGFDNLAQVFVFSRESVVDRQPEFAARELLPVFKEHLEAMAAKVQTRFSLKIDVGGLYDFAAGAYRFSTASAKADVLPPPWSFSGTLPADIRAMSNYAAPSINPNNEQFTPPARNLVGLRLGAPVQLVTAAWRSSMVGVRVPQASVLAVDHALQVQPLPVDPARAEALTKKNATFRVRITMTVDHAITYNRVGPGGNDPAAVLTGRIEKMELVSVTPSTTSFGNSDSQDEEVMATYV